MKGLAVLAILFGFGFAGNPCAREYSVLAVRVDFPYEDPDHDTTSGRGKFDLRNYYDESESALRSQYRNPWDVPPHDRRYFENHLLALRNYWWTVSEGGVDISYEVWPREPDGAYTLSRKFYKYGNGRTRVQVYEKLVTLLEEALTACKRAEGDGIDFSRYDTFMVIHAGIGSETSGGLNDIPSAFISHDDILKYLDGRLVIDGKEIDNGLVVPEMTAANGYGGLNGIMAQMFGHRLGLPSLSNNEDGLPAAGGWCLMDTGSMAYGHHTRGFVPTHPCAWSKIELGWVEPAVVMSDTTLSIAATHVKSDLPKAVKIPITGDEYLLLENRIRYAPRDSLPGVVFSDSDTSGVWLEVDHYDAYIPGSGILIWHINDGIIKEKRADNAINDDIYRRGIDLLEADGRQDIGAYIGFGDPRGEYTEGHDDDTFKVGGRTVLSPDTNPGSGSMWGGNSGITVKVESEPADTMTVTITFGNRLKGFPIRIGARYLTSADLNGDGIDELIATKDDTTFVLDASGHFLGKLASRNVHPDHPAFFIDGAGKSYLFKNGENGFGVIRVDDGTFSRVVDFIHGSPGESRTPEANSLVTAVSSDLYAVFADRFARNGAGSPGEPRLGVYRLFQDLRFISIPDTNTITHVSAASGFLATTDTGGNLYMGTVDDEEMAKYPVDSERLSAPLIVDLDRDDVYETVVAGDDMLYIFRPDGGFDTAHLPAAPVGDPAAADIDGDGYPEIIQCTERGVCAFRKGGIPTEGFPFTLPPGDRDERITTSPVVADLDGDGSLDIGFATSNMRFLAFGAGGQATNGFPLALRGEVEHPPLVFRYDEEGSLALAYVTTDGLLAARRLGVRGEKGGMPWPMWRGGPELTSSLTNDEIPSETKKTAPFEAYCYPNPITGGFGTFRIIPSGPTDCRITVYTADGSRVFSARLAESEVIPGVPNEVRMDVSELASGLYIAKITTRQKTVFYKVGVLK